jgi:ribonucleotide monophosphatase NagD (HAD superfamily)
MNCAYVGDNPTGDVQGAPRAGYGMVIILTTPEMQDVVIPTGASKPDMTIDSLKDLLNIFPLQ